jgi:hypothetical protein
MLHCDVHTVRGLDDINDNGVITGSYQFSYLNAVGFFDVALGQVARLPNQYGRLRTRHELIAGNSR